MAKSPTLVTSLFENHHPAAEDPMKPHMSLYEFVGRKSDSITTQEYVEVISTM